jgi:signal transduction histidine kinase
MEDQLEHRETELERKNKELMQTKKLAAIGTLASGVAHELNNPLNNIYLSAQVLAKEAGESCPVPIRDAVSDIVGQTARVKRIVGDLLEFARGREPQLREMELHGLITSSYKHLAVSQNVEKVRFSLAPCSEKLFIHADPAQMEQVFVNLFTNAVDAMSGNGDLTVTVTEEESSIRVKVADSGKGIARESLDKVFEPFFTTKDKGTGLGLAIVFNIIKKHNGEIRVESEEGKGTTFTITLPRQGK